MASDLQTVKDLCKLILATAEKDRELVHEFCKHATRLEKIAQKLSGDAPSAQQSSEAIDIIYQDIVQTTAQLIENANKSVEKAHRCLKN